MNHRVFVILLISAGIASHCTSPVQKGDVIRVDGLFQFKNLHHSILKRKKVLPKVVSEYSIDLRDVTCDFTQSVIVPNVQFHEYYLNLEYYDPTDEHFPDTIRDFISLDTHKCYVDSIFRDKGNNDFLPVCSMLSEISHLTFDHRDYLVLFFYYFTGTTTHYQYKPCIIQDFKSKTPLLIVAPGLSASPSHLMFGDFNHDNNLDYAYLNRNKVYMYSLQNDEFVLDDDVYISLFDTLNAKMIDFKNTKWDFP